MRNDAMIFVFQFNSVGRTISITDTKSMKLVSARTSVLIVDHDLFPHKKNVLLNQKFTTTTTRIFL